MFDNKWQKKEMPLVSLIGMGGGIASPAFLASIVLNILKPTVFSPADDTGVPDFDYTAESSAITNVNQISGGWSSASFDSNGASNQWQSVAYGNGKYVALGKIGNAYLAANSTDGINWTSYNTIPYTSYSELVYGNGTFVAVGNGKIVYSTDEGESWSSASVASNWWQGVTYGDGKFVAVAEDGTNRVATSSDGVNWSETSAPGNYMWLAVTYGGGKFVAVSQMGDAMYSSDGTNWSITSVPESEVWNSVAYGNGKFVAVAGLDTMYSTDGINWFSGNNTTGYWKDITFADGRFVAVSNYQDSNYPAVAGHSTDGDTWTPSNQAISGEWNGVDYVNGRFIAVAGTSTPKIMWSTTGVDEATELTLTDTTVSKVSDGTLIEGESIDQVLTVGETVQADTAVTSTVASPVFNATVYKGNSSSGSSNQTQNVDTGINLDAGDGLIIFKQRTGSQPWRWHDTVRGIGYGIESHNTNSQSDYSDQISVSSAGFTVGDTFPYNQISGVDPSNLEKHSAWNFRAAPGFFDIVTYTGQTGEDNFNTNPSLSAVQGYSHNLGVEPGMVIVKQIDASEHWFTRHKNNSVNNVGLTNEVYYNQNLNLTGVEGSSSNMIVNWDAEKFGVTSLCNSRDKQYVAYLFADTPGLIKCGTYTGTGSSQTIDTGFKPKFVITKSRSHSSDWYVMDSETPGKALYTNADMPQQTVPIGYVNNGFTVDGANFALNASGYEYIYMAIAEDAEVDITSDIYASGTVSASSGNTITLSNTTGTWSTGMKVQGVTTDTKDNPDPIKVENVSLTSSAPTAERNVNTWGDAIWEIATDENFTQNVQTATTALSATGTQAGPSFTLEPETGYYTRTKYTALGQESEWSDVTYFVTGSLPVYADDVFSTYLFDGTGSAQTITNGIDLSGEGGLTWIKRRSAADPHQLYDTERGANKLLRSTSTSEQVTSFSDLLTSFNSDGFSLGADSGGFGTNPNSSTMVSWSFRKAPGFFDIVTYSGNGGTAANEQQISHNLGSKPGMIFVKRTDATGNWFVYTDVIDGSYDYAYLNDHNGFTDSGNNVFTDSVFNVGGQINSTGGTYVAYLFAHDDQSFGTNGDESIIKCGSYTGNGSSSGPVVNLGFEPQWLLIKRTNDTGDWVLFDNMRGIGAPGVNDKFLTANATNAESTGSRVGINATGFQLTTSSGIVNGNGGEYIYMAIRRPHKPPTSATEVYYQQTGVGPYPSGWPVDLWWSVSSRSNPASWDVFLQTRLLGGEPYLRSSSNVAEIVGVDANFDNNNGVPDLLNFSDSINWFFRRAPGFFDVVAYTGTGSTRTITHNLNSAPEMMIFKIRSTSNSWIVYHKNAGATHYLMLDQTNGADQHSSPFNDTDPTSSVFTLGPSFSANANNQTFIAYLFASLDGISKVGSYTGTGSNINVDCGFTAGARFVLIKRTDSSGDWYVWDTARGIMSGSNDPYLLLNSIDPEVTNTNYIDPLNAGFTVTSSAPASLNASGGEYLFLAIA